MNKGLARQASLGAQNIPMYGSEWIISRHLVNGQIDETARQRMREFINKHLPTKDQKEQLKAKLTHGGTLLILDEYHVEVNLRTNELVLKIPCLDENKAEIESYIVENYPLLLGSGVWGVGRLEYQPPDESLRLPGRIHMVDFRPMQSAAIDYEEYGKAHGQILGTQDIRDRNAVIRLAAGYLKLLFPDLNLIRNELIEYCLLGVAVISSF